MHISYAVFRGGAYFTPYNSKTVRDIRNLIKNAFRNFHKESNKNKFQNRTKNKLDMANNGNNIQEPVKPCALGDESGHKIHIGLCFYRGID